MARTRFISLLVTFMFLAFSHSQALAGFYSGNGLIPLMQEWEKAEANASEVDWFKDREYYAYISGVYDATLFLYSTPAGANRRQIVAVVSKYLKNHPEEWSDPAAVLVTKALTEAFPLKKSK